MRAILEMDIPHTCGQCRLSTNQQGYMFCLAMPDGVDSEVTKYAREDSMARAPNCPLRVVPLGYAEVAST